MDTPSNHYSPTTTTSKPSPQTLTNRGHQPRQINPSISRSVYHWQTFRGSLGSTEGKNLSLRK